MERLWAGVKREEVRQHAAEQVQLAVAVERAWIDAQRGVQAAHGYTFEQPVQRPRVGLFDGLQAGAGGALFGQVGEAGKVVAGQHCAQAFGAVQRQAVERQVRQ
ncbi:hypothetical protein D3C80_1891460 [compost metagenome]